MSGTAALASARRRRAIPQKPEINNEIVENSKQPQNLQPQNLQQQNVQPVATNPAMLLLKHNQLLGVLQKDVELLKLQLSNNSPNVNKDKDNTESLEYYKSQHSILLEEMREVKKTLLKVQTFAMETNLELMKLKKTSSKQENVVELPLSIEE